MTLPKWSDDLRAPDPQHIQWLLTEFWTRLEVMAELLERREYLLAEESITQLRACVIEMMLALNGIERPGGTRHLNGYLGASQRAALERTLTAAGAEGEPWIARAVALTVIYRWYAPQLVQRFELEYPDARERATWQQLILRLPEWPLAVTTD